MLSCLNLHLPVRFGFLLSAAQFWKVLQPILDELLKLLNELPFLLLGRCDRMRCVNLGPYRERVPIQYPKFFPQSKAIFRKCHQTFQQTFFATSLMVFQTFWVDGVFANVAQSQFVWRTKRL